MDIMLRWPGAADATSDSTYMIERTLDWETWDQLGDSKPATSPYATVSSALADEVAYGDTSIPLVSAAAFGSSGYGALDDAFFTWSGKSINTLTGVQWVLGYGVYATGSMVRSLHESYQDVDVTPANGAVVYRITHERDGLAAPADYVWFYAPGAPISSEHCRVIVKAFADVGLKPLVDIPVTCHLADEGDFTRVGNQYVDPKTSSSNTQQTNALGLAMFDVWHSGSRFNSDGKGTATYVFSINNAAPFVVNVDNIPARQVLLLGQLVGD
jgi:hypothetical protein